MLCGVQAEGVWGVGSGVCPLIRYVIYIRAGIGVSIIAWIVKVKVMIDGA